jgi:hypothetical protein
MGGQNSQTQLGKPFWSFEIAPPPQHRKSKKNAPIVENDGINDIKKFYPIECTTIVYI